jgi:hypothetical protein
MRPLAKCEFLFRFSPGSCGYLCGVPGENTGHLLLIFLENARVLALLRDDNENVLRHQPFCPITFPLIGISRTLSCAHSHRLVSPQRQSIYIVALLLLHIRKLSGVGRQQREDNAALSKAVNTSATQEMTGRWGDRRCDSGDSPFQDMGLAFPSSCRRHLRIC